MVGENAEAHGTLQDAASDGEHSFLSPSKILIQKRKNFRSFTLMLAQSQILHLNYQILLGLHSMLATMLRQLLSSMTLNVDAHISKGHTVSTIWLNFTHTHFWIAGESLRYLSLTENRLDHQ
jgi:hypothetical protein